MIDPTHITGIILCGGQARRMGGGAATATAAGTSPRCAYQERLLPQVSTIVISANRERSPTLNGVTASWLTTPDLGPLADCRLLRVVRTPWFSVARDTLSDAGSLEASRMPRDDIRTFSVPA